MLPASWAATTGDAGAVRGNEQGAGFGVSPSAGSADLSRRVAGAGLAGVTVAQARAAIDAFDAAFYVQRGGRGSFRATTAAAAPASFWRTAELIELVEDASQRSGRAVYRTMLLELRRGVVARYGADWTSHRIYNDDVMWMVIAFMRGYEITGRREFLDAAKRNFDVAYARGWSRAFGGGLWWTTDRREKNACVAGPAAIAAWHLYRASGDEAYFAKAQRSFAWLRKRLFDPDTGAVYDHVARGDGGDVVDRATYTYNQGTFIGAAGLLYRATGDESYASDARKALDFARADLSEGEVLREEGIGSDGGGFKGIFARYAVTFAARNGLTEYAPWFSANATAAWKSRDGRGLIGQDWSQPTPGGTLHAFDASSAVVLLQELRPDP